MYHFKKRAIPTIALPVPDGYEIGISVERAEGGQTTRTASVGDWIVFAEDGQTITVLSPDRFKAIYEPADEQAEKIFNESVSGNLPVDPETKLTH